jgi:uncharacterized protein YecE (DUF72 family)
VLTNTGASSSLWPFRFLQEPTKIVSDEMDALTPRIRIGTSGWHYPTGAGTWNGTFYPKPRPKGFDELAFYAESFDFVEINATFYGQPRAEVAAQWAERTPAAFEFAVKLYQQFTHPRMFRERVEQALAAQLGTGDLPPSAIDALVHANRADLDEFKRGIEPLAAAGKLGPLLAQFPASFHNEPSSRAHLAALLRAFHGYSICVELRHKTWNHPQISAMLESFGAAWVDIDEPKFKDSLQRIVHTEREPFVYLRLHGRNARAWWNHANKDDRYDYEYSKEELVPFAKTLAHASGRAYAALNNHPRAQAVTNAKTLKKLVEDVIRAEAETAAPAVERPGTR